MDFVKIIAGQIIKSITLLARLLFEGAWATKGLGMPDLDEEERERGCPRLTLSVPIPNLFFVECIGNWEYTCRNAVDLIYNKTSLSFRIIMRLSVFLFF